LSKIGYFLGRHYLTNDMRYNDYASKDHEGFKPYDIAGMDFFARLVKGLVSLSHQPPLWNKDFAERLYQYKVKVTIQVKKLSISCSF